MNTVATKFGSTDSHVDDSARARTKATYDETVLAVDSMRKCSAKILAQGAAAGGAAASLILEMIRAIWQAIFNILRFLANLFGVKLKQAEADAEAQADADASVKASVMPDGLASSFVSDEVAAKTQSLLQAAMDSPAVEADAFMRALEFSGIASADQALLDFARQPSAITAAEGMDLFLANYLRAVTAALDGLDEHFVKASHERAASARPFVDLYVPPMLTEQVVALQRHALGGGFLSPEDVVKTERLIKADDAMRAVSAQRRLIGDMAMLFASEVASKGVLLEPHTATLERIGGPNWVAKFHAAGEALDGQPQGVETVAIVVPLAVPVVSQQMKDEAMRSVDAIDAAIDANSDLATKAARAAQDVTNFFAGVPGSSVATPDTNPSARLSMADRIKLAAAEIAKSNPSPQDDQQDRFDDFEKP